MNKLLVKFKGVGEVWWRGLGKRKIHLFLCFSFKLFRVMAVWVAIHRELGKCERMR